MAIYHFSAQIISRSSGRSSVAAAAYRSGEKLVNGRDEVTHDYRRKADVAHQEIVTPEHAPQWMTQRETLWNAIEQSEKRVNSQTAREIDVALPRELSLEQNKALLHGYVKEQFVNRGMVADVAIHDANTGNPHAHIMLTTRECDASGFTKKNRDWNKKQLLQEWRERWAGHLNAALADAGSSVRVDHRTLKAQGIDREPQIHLGKSAMQAMKKDLETPRFQRLAKIHQRNSWRLAMHMASRKPAVLAVDKDEENQSRKPKHQRGHWRER